MSNWISYVDKGKKNGKTLFILVIIYLIFKDMTLKQV